MHASKAEKTWTRRSFLQRSGAALGAALGFPIILPSSSLGKSQGASPNDRVNMGFIGLGGQGSGHLLGGAWTYVPGGYVAREDVQVRAVCDVWLSRRTAAQQRCNEVYADRLKQSTYNDVKAYNDFREVLARPDIDAVLLALPYHWAAPMAIRAMRAGKDVYCEKPVAITVRQAQAMAETARRHNRIYQAGTQQRSEYNGKFHKTCELVQNGRIGELKEVYAYRPPGAFLPTPWTSDESVAVPDGFDWDMWLGPLPWRPYGGHTGHALPGLFVGDVNWSPHHYDVIQWTVNPDRNAPVDVEYDNDRIHYHYSSGVVIHSGPYPGEPVGDIGGACYVGTEGRIAVDRDRLVSDPPTILEKPLRPGDKRVYHATSHSGNFLDCVRTRRLTICYPEEAAHSMTSVLIGGIALALKRSLRWNPAKLSFSGDEAANRLLTYAPRAPWHL